MRTEYCPSLMESLADTRIDLHPYHGNHLIFSTKGFPSRNLCNNRSNELILIQFHPKNANSTIFILKVMGKRNAVGNFPFLSQHLTVIKQLLHKLLRVTTN